MKLVHGIALPDSEQHYVETLGRMVGEGVSFEYPALRRALELLPKEKRRVAVDVGAHVGLWSRWLVKHFGFVHAFEPVAEHADIFCQNVSAENYTLHRVALGAFLGSASIKQYPENTGQAHVEGPGDVSMVYLDYYWLDNVDLVKVDVEGYELDVLKGAERTLRNFRPVVIVEQRGCEQWHFGRQRNEALEWLQSIGMVPMDCIHHDWIMAWE